MALPNQVSPPQIALSSAAPTGVVGADVVAVPLLKDEDGPTLGPGAAELLDEISLDVFALLEHHQATGRTGEVVEHPVLSTDGLSNTSLRSVLFVGVGAGRTADLRKAGAALARRVKGKETLATSLAALSDDAGLRALVEGLVLGSFGFHRRSEGAKEKPVSRVVLAGIADAAERQQVLERGIAVAGAGWMARTLALVPANEKSPAWMAERAGEVAASAGLKIKVWDEKQLARDGFGGIVGVGQASSNPPRLIRLDYTPRGAGRDTPHVVLVGKGITFDTGGLSIKPAEAMMNMKRDMTGGGVVLAVMGALADLDCPVRVTGLVPAAENAVGGASLRPGDVLRHYGGRTSEVRNTDTFGVLKLTLHPTSYDWEFVPEAGKTFRDSGTQNCHSSGSPVPSSTATRTRTPTPTSTATRTPTPTASRTPPPGTTQRPATRRSRRPACRSHIRSGWSIPPAPPACPSRSCMRMAAWSSSTSRR